MSVMPRVPPPLPLPASADPRLWDASVVRDAERLLRHRRSWLPQLRRRAHAACLTLIRYREAVCEIDS